MHPRLLTTCFAALVLSASLIPAAEETPRLFSLPAKSFVAPVAATPAQRYELQYREVVEYLLRFYNDYERVAPLLKQNPPAMKTEAERDEAIHKLIASLNDRWTVYRSPDELAEAGRHNMAGDIAFGVTLDEVKNGYVVAYVSGASPAYMAGVKRGDRILAIDGLPISDLNKEVVDELLYGQPGDAKLTVKVQEKEVEVTLHLNPSSAKIVTSYVVDGAWYFHVQGFSSDRILTEFAEHAEALNRANGSPRGIILDLRGNHGGYMDFAYQFVSIFVRDGKVGETVTRSGRLVSRTTLEAQPFAPTLLRQTEANKRLVKTLQTAPLVVLTDGSTISAGEMVASALKGTNRATLIGTTTWGKGVSFHYLNLVGGGQLQLCTGIFLGPDGFDHRNKGVAPHQVVDRVAGDAKDVQLAAGLKALDGKAAPAPVKPLVIARAATMPDYAPIILLVTLMSVAAVVIVVAVSLRRPPGRRYRRMYDAAMDRGVAAWIKQVQPDDKTEPEVLLEVSEPEGDATTSEGKFAVALTLSPDHFMVGACCDHCDHRLRAGETVVELLDQTGSRLVCGDCHPIPQPAPAEVDETADGLMKRPKAGMLAWHSKACLAHAAVLKLLIPTQNRKAVTMSEKLKQRLWSPVAWFRQWPQVGPKTCPDGYKIIHLPPSILGPGDEDATWQPLESLGLIRMADDWFGKHAKYARPVAVPVGWKLIPLVRGRYKLVDDAGIRRGTVEDGSERQPGWVKITRRFDPGYLYIGDYEMVGIVYDHDQDDFIVHQTPMHRRREYEHNSGAAVVKHAARQWLDANHPGWQKPDYARVSEALQGEPVLS